MGKWTLQFTCHRKKESVSGPTPAQNKNSFKRWWPVYGDEQSFLIQKILFFTSPKSWKGWVQILACHFSYFKIDNSAVFRKFSDSTFPHAPSSHSSYFSLLIDCFFLLLIDFCDPVTQWGQRWHQKGSTPFLPNHFFVIRGVLCHVDSVL